MTWRFTATCTILSTAVLLITGGTDGNDGQSSPFDEEIPNYSHQNDTEIFETNFNLKIKQSDSESGWSEWSEWSTCSRSCDGGISFSLRKCNNKKGCTDGSSERTKICNMQPCPIEIDFRAVQCYNYNNKPYRGRLYQWLPFKDTLDPCALTCKTKVFNFVAKLAPRVEDGTRCREGSLDMCVAGKCLSVGCDLQLGSDNKIDECGICGGDGSSCSRPIYIWTQTNYSPCSVSCGRGYQMSHPICIDKEAKEQVDEILCDPSVRPRPHINECNTHKCPPFWIIESWTPCTRRCGSGKQIRDVYCVQDVVNGTRIKVSDNECPKQKPITEKSCNTQECPQWFEGVWSPCSTTCGTGYQTRAVVCRDVRGLYSNECTNETKPFERQNCSIDVPCSHNSYISNENSQEDSPAAGLPLSLPWLQKTTKPSISTEPSFIVGEWSPCSVSCGKGIKKRTVVCKILLQFSKTVAQLQDHQCPGPKPKQIEICLMKDCHHIKDEDQDEEEDDDDIDDDESDNDIINSGVEKPTNKMVPLSKIGIQPKYFWKSAGFTACTASCLGGTQESIILCVKDTDHSVVNPYFCEINKKPDSFTRTCNDHPCPPRWNVTEYGVCSKPCGSGTQTREVQCIHEVTRGSVNTIIVSNHQCAEPMPRNKQICNVFDCPPQWKTEQWSQCSRSCGGGVKTRKLKCIRELAFGQVVEQPVSKCPKKRPKAIKTCNSKQCRNPMLELRKVIHHSKQNKESNKIDENLFVQKDSKKRLSLKVTGEAIVITGTILRLRCPRHKTDKISDKIYWMKDNNKITSNKRIKITPKNILRIKSVEITDSGVYSCSWDNHTFHTINLKIKHLPTISSTIDEDKTVERLHNPSKIGFNDYDFGKVVIESEETDRSHGVPLYKESMDRKNSLMRVKPKRVNHRTTNPLKELAVSEDFSAESPNNNNNERLDTFEVNYGFQNKELSDQNIVNDKAFDNKDIDQNSEEKFRAENKKADSVSQLKKLLTDLTKQTKTQINNNFEDFSNFSELKAIDNKSNHSKHLAVDDNFPLSSFSTGTDKSENLKFNWMTTEWSTCTVSCGSAGYQVRATQCYVVFGNVSKTIDDSFCIDAGLEAPKTMRNCGQPECPFWQSGQWSKCDQCLELRIGVQTREVRCVLNNGTLLDDNKCHSQQKPIAQKQCVNDLCEGSWITADWTQCNANCGEEGIQSRVIQCVWLNSVIPAGDVCKDKTRPEVLRTCVNETCSQNKCEDTSKHCSLAKTLNMCRIEHYKHQCCQSCKSQT